MKTKKICDGMLNLSDGVASTWADTFLISFPNIKNNFSQHLLRSDIYDLRSRNRNFEIAITHEIRERSEN